MVRWNLKDGLMATDVSVGDRFGGYIVTGSFYRNASRTAVFPVRCDCGRTANITLSTLKKNTRGCPYHSKPTAPELDLNYGSYTVTSAPEWVDGRWRVGCRCACGAVKFNLVDNLRSGTSTRCNACRMVPRGPATTLPIGHEVGNWVVVGPPQRSKAEGYVYPVRCVCGKETLQRWRASRGSFVSKSCGCLTKQLISGYWSSREKTTDHPLYSTWSGMRQRCRDKNQKSWPRYGGRGIRVCDEWNESFEAFREWCEANGWTPDLEVDRIDNDGNYEPSNCRLVTRAENNRNKRTNRPVTAWGETKILRDWIEDPRAAGITRAGLTHRLSRGMTPEEAISSPAGRWADRGFTGKAA